VPCPLYSKLGDGPTRSLAEEADYFSAHEKLYDNLFSRIREALSTDPETDSDSKRQRWKLSEENGLLWRDGRQCIPSKDGLRQDALYWHHDVPWMCHLGIEKTLKMVAYQFYWPETNKDISTYIASCAPCQVNKTARTLRTAPLSPFVAPNSCWHTLGVDLIVDLPLSEEGYNSVYVFVRHLSKMDRLIATKTDMTTTGFAKLFLKEVFPHYGFPLHIVSDRGTLWIGEFF
jgi:hypothetical protein